MRLGLVGLGRMGGAILPHLVRGTQSVAVWNRTNSKLVEAEAIGAKIAPSPRDLVEHSDIILSILYDDAAVEEVYRGPEGLLSGDCSDRLFIEMSTIQIETVRKLAATVVEKNASFVDCPVSGSVGPAREGKLLVLAGGDKADIERATPALKLFSRRIAHLGAVGSGIALKLGIQELIYVYWQALGEALSIGTQAGLDLATMLDVIADSPAALSPLKSKFASILGTDPSVAFALAAAAKDLDVITESARAAGLTLPIADVTLARYESALAAGRGNKDIVDIVDFALSPIQEDKNAL